MPVRSCRVTIQDMDGVSHTVEVTAATLYAAVAQGLAAVRGNEWVAGIAQGLNVINVSVARFAQRLDSLSLCVRPCAALPFLFFLALASVASPNSFLAFFFIEHP
jgi:hypothetical protein